MIITRSSLINKKACSEGVAWFDLNFPDGSAEIETLSLALANDGLIEFFRFIAENIQIENTEPLSLPSISGTHYFSPYPLNVVGDVVLTGTMIVVGNFLCQGNFEAESLDTYGSILVQGNLNTSRWVRAEYEAAVGGVNVSNCWEPFSSTLVRAS